MRARRLQVRAVQVGAVQVGAVQVGAVQVGAVPVRAVLVGVGLLAVLAGCSSGPSTSVVPAGAPVATATQASASSSATPAAAVTSSSGPAVAGSAVRGFMKALAARSDPAKMRDGLVFAAPGSPAYAYLTHQANVHEARADGGSPGLDLTLADTDADTVTGCVTPGEDKSCGRFAGFKLDPSGKVVDLSVDGNEVASRLTLGNGQDVVAGGAKFTFLSAYNALNPNALYVTIRVQTGPAAISMGLYEATYRGPDGKQRQAGDRLGPLDLAADSNAVVAVVIPGVKPGGKVTLHGCSPRDCSRSYDAVIQVG